MRKKFTARYIRHGDRDQVLFKDIRYQHDGRLFRDHLWLYAKPAFSNLIPHQMVVLSGQVCRYHKRTHRNKVYRKKSLKKVRLHG